MTAADLDAHRRPRAEVEPDTIRQARKLKKVLEKRRCQDCGAKTYSLERDYCPVCSNERGLVE